MRHLTRLLLLMGLVAPLPLWAAMETIETNNPDILVMSLIHISEHTRQYENSYAGFCRKNKKMYNCQSHLRL